MKNRTIYILLALIFLLATVLRFTKLSEFPVGFHIDEASLGYNGYSLLKTGKEEHGIPFPLYIDMFGDNRPSGYHFLTVIPIALFGLNEFATRFPGALFGSLTVFAMYFFVSQLFFSQITKTKDSRKNAEKNGDKTKEFISNLPIDFLSHVPLVASFLIAISPWHIGLSRASDEAVVALFFILIGFGLLIRSFEQNHLLELIAGTISMSLSFFFYHTPRVFVPLLLISLSVVFFKKWLTYGKTYIATLIITVLSSCLISFSLIFLISGGTGRFSQVNIFSFPETRLVLEEQLREDGTQSLSPTMARLFHNKIINYSLTYITNYLQYFTGEFLFIKGGLPVWYKIPNMGLLYLVELPFIIAGFVYLCIQKKLLYWVPLIWILIAPMTASITTDDIPNINRVIVLFPMLEILASVGIIACMRHIPKSLRVVVVAIFISALAFNFSYFLHQYFIQAKTHQTWYRFNGYKELVLKLESEASNYDKIIVTKSLGGIYPHFLFFMKFDPQTYQNLGSPKDRDYKGFGPYIFVPQACPSIEKDDLFPKAVHPLFVDNGSCKISTIYKSENIYREDGTKAFMIVYPDLLPSRATSSAEPIIQH